ncbi:MAG TPA: Rieske (2Fe-2S) protein, partial [Chloroflexota bacterium]|nr:Rieske (2Fe-2S) protein [Chloroflexota bacterium]
RALAALPDDPGALLRLVSDACEGQGGVDEAGAAVYRYLALGHDPDAAIRTLGHVTLREDASFHDYQMLEEGARLAKDLLAAGKRDAAFQTLVAIARWQAAHAPTRRAVTQTYDIALRLHRGEAIYEEEPESV